MTGIEMIAVISFISQIVYARHFLCALKCYASNIPRRLELLSLFYM